MATPCWTVLGETETGAVSWNSEAGEQRSKGHSG